MGGRRLFRLSQAKDRQFKLLKKLKKDMRKQLKQSEKGGAPRAPPPPAGFPTLSGPPCLLGAFSVPSVERAAQC